MAPPATKLSPERRRQLEEMHRDLGARVKLQRKVRAEASLYEFVKLMWHAVEPANPLIDGWVLRAICEHLESITFGKIRKLIVNVPPGAMKSLASCVFWPAWEWGPRNLPSHRFMAFSYTSSLTERDNGRVEQLIQDPLYQEYWGDRFKLAGGKIKLQNNKTGWKLATSLDGVGTGERADRLICFPGDVRIQTDRGLFPIGRIVKEKMRVQIMGWDGADRVWQKIANYQENETRPLVKVSFFDDSSLRCTEDHRIYTPDGEKVEARNLRPGDEVRAVNHVKMVRSVLWEQYPEPVYNIEVHPHHNYFADDVLVANCDDLNNVKQSESRAILDSTNQWIREVMPTRLNHLGQSAIVAIQQRTNEEDCTGTLLDGGDDWTWLMIPMKYEPDRHCATEIGWSDPRTIEGELCWPERFSEEEVKKLAKTLGSYAEAGQLQQRPAPRGGGIIKDEWWQPWENKILPPLSYVLASLDTASTEKDSSDYSALVIIGCFEDSGSIVGNDFTGYDFIASADDPDGRVAVTHATIPKMMVIAAWQEKLDLPGIVRKTIEYCARFKVDTLVIENKSRGHDVNNEIKRMLASKPFTVAMSNPVTDKWSRLMSVQNLFEEGLVYTCGSWDEDGNWTWRTWADTLIRQVGMFPRGAHDDLVDALTMGLRTLRMRGFAPRKEEAVDGIMSQVRHKRKPGALYPV